MSQVLKIVFAAMAVPLLAGCANDSPRTHFDWGVNDQLPRHTAAGANTYTYKDKDARSEPRPLSNNASNMSGASDTPSRPIPSRPAVTSQPLPPPGSTSSNAPVSTSSAPAFAWPVNGRVISDFGATANGGKNDGVNIAANTGDPIRAAAAGTVSYAGDELKNYGNLVLVKHTGGFTTAYAHAERLVVAKGDFVARGQIIGYVGQTGDVTSPQVHFEIRQQTTPLNPHTYLSAATASN